MDSQFDWSEHTWDVIDKTFEDPDFLISHQINSFDNLVTDTLPRLFMHHCPIVVGTDRDSGTGEYKRYYEFKILKCYISKPVQHNTDSGYQPLYPHESRLRDLTYGAPVFIDYEQRYVSGVADEKVQTVIEQKVPIIGRMPIMVGSRYCHLYGKSVAERVALNECKYDRGGYFIVNGNEKVVVAQERPVDNKIMLFKESASSSHTFVARAEVKSTIDQRFYPIKACSVYLSKQKAQTKQTAGQEYIPGQKFEVGIPHIRLPKGRNGVPLFIVFRALGIITDKEIMEQILGDLSNVDNDIINMLLPSAHESAKVSTQYDAINYIAQFVNFTPPTEVKDPAIKDKLRLQYTKDIINREYLSHVGQDNIKKAVFLACMTRKLLNALINPTLFSDRDHYSNKRVDTTGPLLAQIIRYNFLKLVKELKQNFVKELSTGGGISQNVRKIIQKCNIESRLKYALSTGNWHTTRAQANSESKKGIAQVLNRLSYVGMLAHCRRVQSPLERAGSKHEPPRRYHSTQIGKICPNETPEGQQVGTVKNLALMCHVSIECSSYPIRFILSKLGVTDICKADPRLIAGSTNVFINGDLVGIIEDTDLASKIYQSIKLFKLNRNISEYTSVSWFNELNELVIYTDGGRYCRPLYIVTPENHFKLDYWVKQKLEEGSGSSFSDFFKKDVSWEQLKYGHPDFETEEITYQTGAVVEYLDTNEEECSMIAVFPHQLIAGQAQHGILPDSTEAVIRLGYKDSRITIADLETPEQVHDYIREQLTDSVQLQEMWDSVTVTEIVDKTNSVIRVQFSTADETVATRAFVKYLNRFIYPDYVTYTHCEIHPAMWHSVVAQMIPFPDHNQSPRNCYQCLHKDEMVLMSDGKYKKIADISIGEHVITVDPATLERRSAKVINHYVKSTDKKIVKITTISGRDLVCTDDHPILSIVHDNDKPIWFKAGELTNNSKIAVCPSVIPYELDVSGVVITKEEAVTMLERYNIDKSLIAKHMTELEKLELLPLHHDDERTPILARMFGYLVTDGHSNVYREAPHIAMTFGSLGGCNKFLDDAEKIGFRKNKITEVSSTVKGVMHHGWQVIYNNAFASLMIILGPVMGKKTEQAASPVPLWIKSGSTLTKREFLAGFQGGDGCKIRCNSLNGRKSPNYILNVTMQQKCELHKDSQIKYMTELQELFDEFGIATKNIYCAKNTKVDDRYNIGIVFDCTRDNIINYYERIGYRYDDHKVNDSAMVYEYLKYQQTIIAKINDLKKQVVELYDSGLQNYEVARKLGITAGESSTYYRSRNMNTRLPNNHMSYDQWSKQVVEINGTLFVPILNVQEHENVEIADITIDAESHSFITGNNICVHNSSMGKQALGIFATNYAIRVDTMANVLVYPHRPLVQPRTMKYTKMDELPHGYQSIVAVACFTGYNQEDSVMVHKAAVERGMFNSIYYRTYTNKLQKHKTANTAQETFGIPPDSKTLARRTGTGPRDRYHAIDRVSGQPVIGKYMHEDDILIAKYKKVPNDSNGEILFEDASTLVKEPGVVDFIIPNPQFSNNENAEGYRFIKARTSNLRKPIVGDKLASRAAQKGTIGMVYRTSDMPCTKDGIVPDIIMNPHAFPSRMTIAQWLESLLGKAALLSGRTRDATPFTEFKIEKLQEEISRYGYDYYGNEMMYNGQTGEMFKVAIFINPTYYQRLKHMVLDKYHSRDLGPVQLMTRQPAEGRSRDGGLRIGEMERDCIIAHGAPMFLKEKMNESSDIFRVYVSKDKSSIIAANPDLGVYRYGDQEIYETDDVVPLNMPFAQNLLLAEMKTILIDTQLETS